MKDEMIPYEGVAWERIVGRRHALEVILEKQMHAYVKVDQAKYFVHVTEAIAPQTAVSFSSRQEVVSRQRGASLPNETILMLRLAESQIDEIRATGVCAVNSFTCGGLSRRYRPRLKLGTLRSKEQVEEERKEKLFTPTDFVECLLFEKELSAEQPSPESPGKSNAIRERRAARIEIRSNDLFLSESDIDLLCRTGMSTWQVVDYPLRMLQSSLPIYWAYQASIALNRDATPMPDGVLGWLQQNAPEKAYAIRGIRTLTSMVRLAYRHSGDFDRVSLDKFPKAQELPTEYISKPVRLLMDISDWWVDHWSYNEYETVELWRKLIAAGFGKTAIRNLYSAIAGRHASRHALEYFESRMENGVGE